ncbi:hypothetical protein BJX64DRAFT_285514 [Aspergillus heterothallicus]
MKSAQAARRRRDRHLPLAPIISWENLRIFDTYDQDGNHLTSEYLYVAPAGQVYYGVSHRHSSVLRPSTVQSTLRAVPEEEIFPLLPADNTVTVAPAAVLADPRLIFEKQCFLHCYGGQMGTDKCARGFLHEVLVTEKISATDPPHPYIIGYHGCRVEDGRIKSLVLERLERTLGAYAQTPEFASLDKHAFWERIKSAVEHIHALGLAHNDLNPANIMVRETKGGEAEPVLIDFGSCAPFGGELSLTTGTEGWIENLFNTSEKGHDVYALGKLKEWLHDENRSYD